MAEEEQNSQTTEQPDNTAGGQDEQPEVITKEEAQKMVEEAKKEGQTEFARGLSKKLKINVFDDEELDTFVKNMENKVDKTEYDKVKEQVEEYKGYKDERDKYALENALIKHQVNEDYSDKAKKLATLEMQESEDMTYDEAVQKVVEDMPFLAKKKKQVGMDFNDDNSAETGIEAVTKTKYEKDPKTGLYRHKTKN